MRRFLGVLSLALVVVGCNGAAATTPAPAAMPYADYRAAEQAFIDQNAIAAASQAPDFDQFKARIKDALDRWQGENDRLAAVTPEDCYAAAHAELVGYRHDELANYRDAMPMLDNTESVMGLLPIVLMVNGILQKAHPLAFPETSPTPGVVQMGGPALNVMNILDTLSTCP